MSKFYMQTYKNKKLLLHLSLLLAGKNKTAPFETVLNFLMPVFTDYLPRAVVASSKVQFVPSIF